MLLHVRAVLAALLIGGVFACGGRVSAQPPRFFTEPTLRIEPGMHTTTVSAVSVDAAGRYIATSSTDKTVRVWERATGRLLRILRPPIGEGAVGMMYAVALSPDGSTIACGGYGGVLLFDRASGVLLRRIAGMPGSVICVKFSNNGKYLAVALKSGGLRVFNTASGALAAQDTDYGFYTASLDWDKSGRLVTSCYDGFLRLYNPQFRRVVIVKPFSDGRPHNVRFSPDGTKIALGNDAVPQVAVLSGVTLAKEYTPDTTGTTTNLAIVSWSSDGAFLYAGGRWSQENGDGPIRCWADGGRGAFTDLTVARNTIMGITPLPDGGMVYGAFDPAVGLFDSAGKRTWFHASPNADFAGGREQLRVSANGEAIAFPYEKFGKAVARFAVAGGRGLNIGSEPMDSSSLTAPDVTRRSDVTDWEGTTAPKFKGTPLELVPNEISRSLAYTDSGFLLGTEFNLRCYDAAGTLRWKYQSPSIVWAVNASADGRFGIAAFGDGTIRWFRITDGKELLAFYPSADRKRWVLWTPTGYYDCSPGAEDLIGWHLNRGEDREADFFPASRFRDRFYRPDILDRVLQTGDEAQAVRLADAELGKKTAPKTIAEILPPVVQIVSPADGVTLMPGQSTVAVRFSVRSPADAPATTFQARVDGRPAVSEQKLAEGVREQTISVPLPSGQSEHTVSIIARNKNAISVAASFLVRAAIVTKGAETSTFVPEIADLLKPKLYVLAVGVGKYPKSPAYPNLTYPAKDARDFADALLRQKGGLYRDVEVKVLTDETATRDDIADGLEWVQHAATAHDVTMVFLSGHGDTDSDGTYYYLPYGFDDTRWKRTGVNDADIRLALQKIKGKTLFFVDTCHSGNVLGSGHRKGATGGELNGLINELMSAENGVVVFTAASGRQAAEEKDTWQNGAFTLALLEAINGAGSGRVALNRDTQAVLSLITQTGKITIKALDFYVCERVKELTLGRQSAAGGGYDDVSSNYPIAALRK